MLMPLDFKRGMLSQNIRKVVAGFTNILFYVSKMCFSQWDITILIRSLWGGEVKDMLIPFARALFYSFTFLRMLIYFRFSMSANLFEVLKQISINSLLFLCAKSSKFVIGFVILLRLINV